jgi:hypothetical protein
MHAKRRRSDYEKEYARALGLRGRERGAFHSDIHHDHERDLSRS